jgi:hypothetical protein
LTVLQRPNDDRFLFGSLCCLIQFVAFVPHRYVYTYDSGIVGQLIGWIPLLPVILCFGLLLRVVLGDGYSPPKALASVQIAIVVWVGLTALGGLGSELSEQTVQRDIYYALTGVALTVVAHYAFLRRTEQAVVALAAPAALIGVFCCYEFVSGVRPFWGDIFTQENVRYFQFASDDFGQRVLGTVGHPVYLGAFLVLTAPLALWCFFQSRGSYRVISIPLVAGVFTGLLLTFSRGAWLGAAVGGLIYLRRRSSRQIWAAALVGVVILTAAFSVNRVWRTLESRGTVGQIRSFRTDQRGIAYMQATAILAQRPFLGVGTGMYRYARRSVGDYNDTPDSMYLRMLSEHGIAGFAAAIALVSLIIRRIHVAGLLLETRGLRRESDLCLAIVAGIAGFLVDMITCDALYFPLTRISFWTVAGLGLAAANESDDFGVTS